MKFKTCLFLVFVLLLINCRPDNEEYIEQQDAEFDGTEYLLDYPFHFAPPLLPEDNPLTVQGVKLGKMLFHETLLSGNNSQSCATCHLQHFAFTDTSRFSIGIEGLQGERQAMSVFNMAWNDHGFFWDGRAMQLRDQALMPIEDPLEMNETLENAINKLDNSQRYRDQFMRTFGSEEITSEKIGLAMEQFMLSIVSGTSKYDNYVLGTAQLTEEEERGRALFFTDYNPFFPEDSGADCVHCHSGFNFENDQYMNNGLDTEDQITDIGRMNVSGDLNDKAKFKVTSLRNIALTAPYMHDGRFNTLEQVIEHYNSGIQTSNTTNAALLSTQSTGLMLTEQDKSDLIAFLNTFTDPLLLSTTNYSEE